MAQVCAVCKHPARSAIDLALATDDMTVRGAAFRWQLDRSAVWRHRARHLPLSLSKAAEAAGIASAARILDELEKIRRLAAALAAQALSGQDRRLALQALDRQLAALGLLARVAGVTGPEVSVQLIQQAPAWQELKGRLVAALEAFPDARRAVLAALEAAA